MWARMSTSPQHVVMKLLCVRKQQPRRCFNLRSCFSHAALNAQIIPTPSWVSLEQQKVSPRRKYSPLPPTNIYTDFILPHTFFLRDVVWFFPPLPISSPPPFFWSQSDWYHRLSSFTAWRRSWHPGRHVKPWRTGGNKLENSSNLQEKFSIHSHARSSLSSYPGLEDKEKKNQYRNTVLDKSGEGERARPGWV